MLPMICNDICIIWKSFSIVKKADHFPIDQNTLHDLYYSMRMIISKSNYINYFIKCFTNDLSFKIHKIGNISC